MCSDHHLISCCLPAVHVTLFDDKLWQTHPLVHAPVQRHITGVLKNTRVFDEKYPGIFQYPGFMMSHYRGIDKYPGIFHKIPGYLTACKIPGYMTAETTCGLYRHNTSVLSFTDFSLSSSFECYVNGYYWKGVSGGGGQGSDCKQKYGRNYIFEGFWSSKKLALPHGM